MENSQIASLSLKVDPDALRSIVSSGRLMEFTNAVAAEAANQISAQLVQHVAEGPSKDQQGGASVEVHYVMMEGGSYGFTPPGHHPPIATPVNKTVIVVNLPFPNR